MKYLFLFVLSLLFSFQLSASYIFLPMEHDKQKDHLKAYGITYWVVNSGVEAYWLLNYRGGSFAFPYTKLFEKECKVRGVTFEVISDSEWISMREKISNPEINQEVIKLEKAPKIAVYTPDFNPMGKRIQPWDDAVTLVLTYAEIPFDKIYDREVIGEKLVEYDWLHLHHEDFTGQYGKFYSNQGGQAWYKMNQQKSEDIATALGFSKVSHLKLAVAKKIKEFVSGGGFMFAMCSATDTYDIALAAEGIDICSDVYDGDGYDINANSKLDYSKTFAFKDFQLILNPMVYEHSDIDNKNRKIAPEVDYFNLFEFSAKWDPIPTMLCQNHTQTVKGFMGQSTTFKRSLVKPEILVMGENKAAGEARYIHGTFGYGTWTFYGGHDPEDYQHFVNDPETDLSLHPNSPGYRLILNNILFPAAEKKKRKT
ncbi:MAG: asparagine synthetase B [Saprospiraceae bacterium]|nr:asparagine synthetase B [Saprospiraceae bacterium]MBK7522668.1 asparagine synthetase B [Saprospiraceae bacterium]MBK8080021.1 asparagine synthetase B [Saprospiraceae bacterium]MBK8370848.1 asparagine synthetase B [Saprospiraceae bacterium]MBK8818240.1 asparagine synthetase B [Saprospiraceae bacterium]